MTCYSYKAISVNVSMIYKWCLIQTCYIETYEWIHFVFYLYFKKKIEVFLQSRCLCLCHSRLKTNIDHNFFISECIVFKLGHSNLLDKTFKKTKLNWVNFVINEQIWLILWQNNIYDKSNILIKYGLVLYMTLTIKVKLWILLKLL